MVRLLVVDDNPADVLWLRALLSEQAKRPHEVYVATNGSNALNFLYCRGPYFDAPRPNLILLDINMPGINGLEVLKKIKSEPDLSLIPVIMLSSSNSVEEVHKAYAAHANCYVRKPSNLDRSTRIIQAIEAFWMDVAVLPACDEKSAVPVQEIAVR